jgi:hypothetical protein
VIGAAANVGYVIIGLVGLAFKVTTETWRWVAVVGAAPAVLTFAVMTLVPESQKWHASTHAGTGKPKGGNPLREIFGPNLLRTTLIAIALSSVALIGTWGSVQWLPLWADKLAGATNPYAKAYAQIASALGAVCACLIGAWACDIVSRRLTYFLLSLGSLGFCAWLFRGVDAYGTMFLALTFAVGGVTAMFYGWLPLYLPELFPTRVRATGQGLAFNSGRILAAVGALQMGALMQTFHGSYAQAGAVISLVYVLGLGVIWLAPETKGKPLPE